MMLWKALGLGVSITCHYRIRRRPDGTRPFKLVEAEPLQTSYGTDLYRAIFGDVSGKVLQQERKQ